MALIDQKPRGDRFEGSKRVKIGQIEDAKK
jgi:hypothetical protein